MLVAKITKRPLNLSALGEQFPYMGICQCHRSGAYTAPWDWLAIPSYSRTFALDSNPAALRWAAVAVKNQPWACILSCP